MKTKIKNATEKVEKTELRKLGLAHLYPKVHWSSNGVIQVCFGKDAVWKKVKPEAQVSQSPSVSRPPKRAYA